jgi:DNA-binding CsgD family transcriptional regulator
MADTPVADMQELVSAFLKRRESRMHGESPYNDDAEEILFDIEVDGARYLLIRAQKPARLHLQLSPREHEIIRLVAMGHSNKIIADVLNISSWTVGTHMRRIFAKLGVASRAAMVALLPEIRRHPSFDWTDPKSPMAQSKRQAKHAAAVDSLD